MKKWNNSYKHVQGSKTETLVIRETGVLSNKYFSKNVTYSN